jgi:hypothetical protein
VCSACFLRLPTCRTQNDTNEGVISCLDPFLPPRRMNYHMHRTRKNTFVGVFSCSAPFLRPTTHETTPTLVSFCVRHRFLALRARNHTTEGVISCSASFFLLPHTPSMKQRPRWCCFMFGVFSLPYHRCRIRNDTLVGVISCSDPFLPPSDGHRSPAGKILVTRTHVQPNP